MPSGEVAAIVLVELDTTQNNPSSALQQTEAQLDEGIVLDVQLIPLGEVAASAPGATATNKESSGAQVTDCQELLLGKVLEVQVIPSGEVAATVEGPAATVQKSPSSGAQVTLLQV
jgi:hypothetical protein